MLKAKLYFTRRQGTDDIVQIYDDELYFEMTRVVYTPGEHTKKSNEFSLTRQQALSYVSTILRSMQTDTDPFEYVQVSTAIHPSVIYSVADVSEASTRFLIEDMVYDALKANVEEIKLKRTVRSPVE